jgi:hypothetical protein
VFRNAVRILFFFLGLYLTILSVDGLVFPDEEQTLSDPWVVPLTMAVGLTAWAIAIYWQPKRSRSADEARRRAR